MRTRGAQNFTSPETGADPGPLADIERQVFECLSMGLVVFDPHLNVIYHNRAAAELIAGYSNLSEALRARTVDARYQDWAAALQDVLSKRHEQRFEQIVFRSEGNGGAERLFNLQSIPLTDSATTVTGGILVLEDITAQVGLEQRLAVSERMAAVGKLAARVAHELNNPLDGILRYLNLSLRALDVGQIERLRDYLAHARGGLMRMTEIIRELVEFSRSSHTTFDDTGINAAIDEAVRVMSDKAMSSRVSIICRLAEDMPLIRGTSLFQVFCNLIKNAIDAMPEGGTLSIITEIVGNEAVIRFEDTGVGLPAELHRLFEPFFTTKPPGKGTGLGLAICKDIIEKYGGHITPSQRPEGGAVFTIRLPLANGAAQRPPTPDSVVHVEERGSKS